MAWHLKVAFIACVCMGAVLSTHGADTALDARQRYDQAWLPVERKSKDKISRIRLSMSLLNAADKTGLKHYKVLLLEKSYLWGVRQQESYPSAALALRQMQEADHSRRFYAMDKLAGIYHRIYTSSPTKRLGDGKGLVETRYLASNQRLADLLAKHEAGRANKLEFLSGLSATKRDYYQAASTATRIIATAKKYVRTQRSTQKREALNGFIAEVSTMDRKIKAAQKELESLKKEYLAGAFGQTKVASADPVPSTTPSTSTPSTSPKPAGSTTGGSTGSSGGADRPLSEIPGAGTKTSTRTTSKRTWRRTSNCANCQRTFIPEVGSAATKCYWCKGGSKSIFDVGKSK
jgi:hypothetical protein